MLYDYIQFFEAINEYDNTGCGKCFCVFFHTHQTAKQWITNDFIKNRDMAIELINNDVLSGFLAYHNNIPVVWCNVNDSNHYHSPLSLYLKNGFSFIEEMEEYDDFGDYEQYAVVRYLL